MTQRRNDLDIGVASSLGGTRFSKNEVSRVAGGLTRNGASVRG